MKRFFYAFIFIGIVKKKYVIGTFQVTEALLIKLKSLILHSFPTAMRQWYMSGGT